MICTVVPVRINIKDMRVRFYILLKFPVKFAYFLIHFRYRCRTDATTTLVWVNLLANCEIRLRLFSVLLLNTSFVPPIKKSTSLLANLATLAWADTINDLILQLGSVYPITSNLSLNMSFNFPDKPRA